VRSLRRIGEKLAVWNADGRHDAVIARLKTQLDSVCGKLNPADPQRAACDGILRKAARASV
jgi:hypothetical protein